VDCSVVVRYGSHSANKQALLMEYLLDISVIQIGVQCGVVITSPTIDRESLAWRQVSEPSTQCIQTVEKCEGLLQDTEVVA
jgi:hypothetical protein